MTSLVLSAAKAIAKAPIYAYRYLVSPWIGPACRFQPTCSAYGLEAIEKHGALKGGWLTIRRLAKCHPITWLGGSHGYDPVPDKILHRDTPLQLSGKKE